MGYIANHTPELSAFERLCGDGMTPSHWLQSGWLFCPHASVQLPRPRGRKSRSGSLEIVAVAGVPLGLQPAVLQALMRTA